MQNVTVSATLSLNPPRFKMLCLPHAGGGSRLYRSWIGAFGMQGIETIPVQLPGRENLLHLTPLTSLTAMVDWIFSEYRDAFRTPCILVGHSMGALIAYALARRLTAIPDGVGYAPPQLLVVAGFRPPHLPRAAPDLHRLPTADFWRALHDYGGIDAAILAEPDLQSLIEPFIRSDFQAVETYTHVPHGERLACPILSLAGIRDELALPAVMIHWRELTCEEFRQITIKGNHFFPASSPEPVLAAIRDAVRDLANPTAVGTKVSPADTL
jgi:medium-chain acyl-[acyl-carrier-protein] hydrolase